MRKRIISLVLALTMICAMAISASAASYSWEGNYSAGSSIFVGATCTTVKLSSSLLTDSPYTVRTIAKAYGWKLAVENGEYVVVDAPYDVYATFSASATTAVDLYEVHTDASLFRATFEHYVNGELVHSHSVSAL